jgi:hypothetical protein
MLFPASRQKDNIQAFTQRPVNIPAVRSQSGQTHQQDAALDIRSIALEVVLATSLASEMCS